MKTLLWKGGSHARYSVNVKRNVYGNGIRGAAVDCGADFALLRTAEIACRTGTQNPLFGDPLPIRAGGLEEVGREKHVNSRSAKAFQNAESIMPMRDVFQRLSGSLCQALLQCPRR